MITCCGVELRRTARRAACLLGLHRWTFWYAPTGLDVDPLYEPRVECLWCLKRRGA